MELVEDLVRGVDLVDLGGIPQHLGAERRSVRVKRTGHGLTLPWLRSCGKPPVPGGRDKIIPAPMKREVLLRDSDERDGDHPLPIALLRWGEGGVRGSAWRTSCCRPSHHAGGMSHGCPVQHSASCIWLEFLPGGGGGMPRAWVDFRCIRLARTMRAKASRPSTAF